MAECGCEPGEPETAGQKRVLWIAFALNAVMFVAEVTVGITVDSTALVADGLDMLSDASVYAIALFAIGRSDRFKATAASWSGVMLLVLGFGLLAEVIRRGLGDSAPAGIWMIVLSVVALAVNIVVLRLLAHQRNGEIHLRAAWIFTRADVVANAAVLLSGLAVAATGNRYFDLAVGAAIAVYVIREAGEILREAGKARRSPG